ncbi:MAG TPA: hypothetical protein ENI97_08520 [Gammaproteobacteria bacterium]|nr:hypothetical protein [Gammaproteobacteria bacterium]
MDSIDSVLEELNQSHPQILLSMVITPDGLALAYCGNVDDFERVGALYIELQLVCRKIMAELDYGDVEEMFVRSKSGCVMLLPVAEKGLLACLSSSDVNAAKMQMFTWQAVNKLSRIL